MVLIEFALGNIDIFLTQIFYVVQIEIEELRGTHILLRIYLIRKRARAGGVSISGDFA